MVFILPFGGCGFFVYLFVAFAIVVCGGLFVVFAYELQYVFMQLILSIVLGHYLEEFRFFFCFLIVCFCRVS